MFATNRWPDAMKTSRTPFHFTNERAVDGVSPEAVRAVLTDVAIWPRFDPNLSGVALLDGAATLKLGARFEVGLAGPDVPSTVQEFEPVTRIAWSGGPKVHPDATADHAWIVTPTATGTPSVDRRDDAGTAPDRARQGGARSFLTRSRTPASRPGDGRHRARPVNRAATAPNFNQARGDQP